MNEPREPLPRPELPDELARAQSVKRRKGSVFRAIVAIVVAFAMVAGGVLVTLAVLTGGPVRADAPLDPATPTASLPQALPQVDPALAPSLEGTTFTIPFEGGEPGDLELAVRNVYIYDPSAEFDAGRYSRAMGGYSPVIGGASARHAVVEGMLTNHSDHDVMPEVSAGYLLSHFQGFLRDAAGNVSREVAKVGGDPLTAFSYLSPKPLRSGVPNQFVLVFPLGNDAVPAQLGIAPGVAWSDQAVWLDVSGLAGSGPSF
ncbi:hypothetical protein INS90_00250 [Trueperella pecoris]|uniref:Uncharacterized protein n=1 Tax=Trueperella pecoris TaxID=2733571 RepID=A0A7M1R0X3_9ACTO|nr:hypothetical protein [Trueperella pecoris]QOR47783.1 hypothetical protein INS90_00250 [Trueperella pecoris]